MSRQRDERTAGELLAELEKDPEFVRQREEREREHQERVARTKKILDAILAELAQVGVHAASWNDLLPLYAPLPREALAVLLSWLSRIDDETDVETIVRALGASVVPYDGTPLVATFENARSEYLRFAVANTLAISNPTGVADWVLKAVQDPRWGQAREMLATAAARLAQPEAANPILVGLLPDMPVPVARALAISGREEEVPALETMQERVKGWQKKEFEKAIRAIRKRGGS